MEEERIRENGLTLFDIWLIIKSNLLAVAIIIVAFIVVGLVYTSYEKPSYKSTASVLVSYKDETGDTLATTELSVSRFLADEYVEMLKDDKIMLSAKDKLLTMGIVASTSSMRGNLSLSHNENGVYIKMEYVCGDPIFAQKILRCIIDSSIEILNEIKKDDEGNEIFDAAGRPVYVHEKLHDSLQLFGEPTAGTQVSNKARHTAIFIVFGVVFSCFYVVVREIFNKRFRNYKEIERDLNIPVYAVIPSCNSNKKDKKHGKEVK